MSITEKFSDVNPPAELDHAVQRLRDQYRTPELALDGAPRRLGGGFWAEMWTLQFTQPDGCLLPAKAVLRLAPDSRLAARETAVQAGVADQGFPTPRIHASDTAHGSRRAWSVMDFAEGQPLLAGLNGLRALANLPRLATSLPDTLARVALALHQLDPDPIEAKLIALTNGSAGVDGLLDHYVSQAQVLNDQPLRRLVERVTTTRPNDRPHAVCHGDLHPFNVLGRDGQSVVLDWTAAQITHPAYDLAFTHLVLAHPPLDAPRPLRPIINGAARRVANRFITTYQRHSPHTIDSDTLTWYRSLQACRILIDLAGWRANDTTDSHCGHPWFAIEPALRPLLRP